MKTIFDKTTKLNNLNLKNRLIRSATWEAMCDSNGDFSKKLIDLYEELATGGVGAIITGFTSVSQLDTGLKGMMRLCDDNLIPKYKTLTQGVKAQDCKILTQLALGEYIKVDSSGKKSKVKIDDLSQNDINNIITLFANAARRAKQAGFDGVQIHASHGFFLSRFINSAYNHRTDSYGGSSKKRAKILVDILAAIREVAPDIHVTVKINCNDFVQGAGNSEDSMVACLELAKHNIDSIEVSGNGTSHSIIRPMIDEAYFLDFAKELSKETSTPIILVGGHRSIENMNNILNETKIDHFSMSRPLIREPNLPNRWKNGDTGYSTCTSCNGCYRSINHQCIFNVEYC